MNRFLSTIETISNRSDYEQYRDALIMNLENEALSVQSNPTPTFVGIESAVSGDGTHHVIFGFGYDLTVRRNSIQSLINDFVAGNISLSGIAPSGRTHEEELRRWANTQITDNELVTQLQNLGATRGNAASLVNILANRFETRTGNPVGTPPTARGLDQILTGNSIALGDSREKAALSAMFYQRPGDPILDAGALIGPSLLAALAANDRTRAWYEIRFRSNQGRTTGQDNRQLKISAVFRLYTGNVDGTTPRDEVEAKDVIQNFTASDKQTSISNYLNEISFSSYPDPVGERLDRFDSAFRPAGRFLIQYFGQGLSGDPVFPLGILGRSNVQNGINVYVDQAGHSGPIALYDNGSGRDLVFGEDGNDEIDAGESQDVIYGGEGNDAIHGGTGDDFILGDSDNRISGANILEDQGLISGNDTLFGDAGEDYLIGGAGNDTIDGGADNDAIYGDASDPNSAVSGNDVLFGGAGADQIFGGKGNDALHGDDDGAGQHDSDMLCGGAGADTFYVDDGDVICDGDSSDKIIWQGKQLRGGGRETPQPDQNGEIEEKPFEGVYGERYQRDKATGDLIIILPEDGGTITVQGWNNAKGGKLGIQLDEHKADIFGGSQFFESPLVMDLDGDGIELTDIKDSGTYFDIDKNGFAERTGWVKADDGLLVWDRNGNGQIDDGGELFGAGTGAILQPNQASGFVALRALDANRDGVIDENDPEFASLGVWQDLNGDGASEPAELSTLNEHGIARIGLSTQVANQTLAGNRLTEISDVGHSDGSTSAIGDVWFAIDAHLARSKTNAAIDPSVAGLPDLRGYGTVKDLHVAMSEDAILKHMVEALVTLDVVGAYTLGQRVEAIIYRWYGVEAVIPQSRASNNGFMNAQQLAALENLFGEQWVRKTDHSTSPGVAASVELQEAWRRHFGQLMMELLAQVPLGQQILAPGIGYFSNAFLELPENTTITSVLDRLSSNAPNDKISAIQYWHSMMLVLDTIQPQFGITQQAYVSAIDAALVGSNVNYDYSTLRTAVVGGSADDFVIGDNIDGFRPSDSANDLIVGGAGSDVMVGGLGEDVYLIGYESYGSDRIIEPEWSRLGADNDIVRFADGIGPADIIFSRDRRDLLIKLANSSYVLRIQNEFGGLISGPLIEQYQFGDGTVLDWTQVHQQLQQPVSAGDDVLFGLNDNDDTLDGGLGNDTLQGGSGNDTYIFNRGYGHDLVVEAKHYYYGLNGDSVDKIQFGSGITPDDVVFALGESQSGFDLVIRISDSDDILRIKDQFAGQPLQIEQFNFADGSQILAAEVPQRLLRATVHDDKLVGTFLNDTLDGIAGNDLLQGKSGDDTYVFGRGYGNDRIEDEDGLNTLRLGANVAPSDLLLSRSGSGLRDLTIQITGTSDSLRVVGQFAGAGHVLNTIQFYDGTVWNVADIQTHTPAVGGTRLPDYLTGTTGADLLDGGAGNDILEGDAGNDTYVFGRGYGNDRITDSNGVLDVIQIKAGVEPIDLIFYRTSGEDSALVIEIADTGDKLEITDFFDLSGDGAGIEEIHFASGEVWTRDDVKAKLSTGTAGDDQITGFAADEALNGGAGNDVISGGEGADIIDGGAGDDTLIDGSGSDTYVFGLGSGRDVLSQESSSTGNIIQLGAGIQASDVVFRRGGSYDSSTYDLIIEISGTTDRLTIKDQLSTRWITEFRLANGASISPATAEQQTLISAKTSGDDSVIGFSGADTLDGGAGNDRLVGMEGANTFIFNTGYGVDRINGNGGGNDKVQFGAGVLPGNVTLGRDGIDLVLQLNSNDRLIVEGQFDPARIQSSTQGVEQFEFTDGTVWTREAIRSQLLQVGSGDDLVLGTAANNTLDGGGGNDWLEGYSGNDTYLFGIGDGQDVVNERGNGSYYESDVGSTADRILFKAGVTPIDVQVSRLTGQAGRVGFVLTVGTGGDQITVQQDAQPGFPPGGTVESFEFADGTIWTWNQLAQRVIDQEKTAGDDTIIGYDGINVTLDGAAGNDTLQGGSGLNTFVFGLGYGADVVVDPVNINSPQYGTETVQIGAGLTASDLIFRHERSTVGSPDDGSYYVREDLVIRIAATGDSIRIQDYFKYLVPANVRLLFADGVTLTPAHIEALTLSAGRTSGDDLLIGTMGADTLDGGPGNDTLEGRTGNDTYVYKRRDGIDRIVEEHIDRNSGAYISNGGGLDRIQFGAGILPGDITLSRSGPTLDDLKIIIAGSPALLPDEITITDQFRFFSSSQGTGTVIDSFEFADGTIWTGEQIWQQLNVATTGDDFLVDRLHHDETFDGGSGDDLLDGRDGNDTYVFGRGYGIDTINDDPSFAAVFEGGGESTTDIVNFGPNIVLADLEFSRTGVTFGDLVIHLAGTTDTLIIKDQLTTDEDLFADYPKGIEEFHFADGTVVHRSQIANMDIPFDTSGDNVVIGDTAGDVLDGGAGNDQLIGDVRNDTYVFGRGYGEDTIIDAGGAVDRVLFAADIDVSVMAFKRTGSDRQDLLIEVDGLERLTLTIREQFNEWARIEWFQLADGTSLSWEDVQRVILISATTGSDDTIIGFTTDDIIAGGAGNDVLDGDSGVDTVDYSASTGGVTVNLEVATAQTVGANQGVDTLSNFENIVGSGFNDNLFGDDGANVLTGGDGNDGLFGQGGSDTLYGGDGNDWLATEAGNDTLDGGNGNDTVDYFGASGGVTVDLAITTGQTIGGSEGVDTLVSIERIQGSAYNDTLFGDGGDNVLNGMAGDDRLSGRAGNDTLSGGDGNDWLVGGSGNDALNGGNGIDTADYSGATTTGITVNLSLTSAQTIGGGEGVDTLNGVENVIGSAQADTITGSSGDNLIAGGGGNDVLNGGSGIDTADYSAATGGVTVDFGISGAQTIGANQGVDTLSNFENIIGSAFNDTMLGNNSANLIVGGAGDDNFFGRGGDDTLDGGDGIDWLHGGSGNDTLIGGPGSDMANYGDATEGITVDLAISTGQTVSSSAGVDTLMGIENVNGSAFNDTLFGDAGANTLLGNAGNDTLFGRAGNNTLSGGDGNDWLVGDSGNDALNGGNGIDTADYSGATTTGVTVNLGLTTAQTIGGNEGVDTLNSIENVIGSAQADTITGSSGDNLIVGGAGNDTLNGGAGIDTVDYSGATGGVKVDVAVTTAQTIGANQGIDMLSNFENVIGSAFNDTLFGNSAANVLTGGAGDDGLYGRAGNNTLNGGDGNDWLATEAGNDTLDGGNGNDTVDYFGASSGVTVDLAITTGQTIGGNEGVDTLISIERIQGSAFNDTLFGDGGANVLSGMSGDDVLYGRAGNNTLNGGDGNDLLVAEAGNDTLDGGNGTDTVDYSAATGSGITVNLSLTTSQTIGGNEGIDKLSGIENVVGSAQADTITGSSSANVLTGGAGNDTLAGAGGNDTLIGGAGVDLYKFGVGDGQDIIVNGVGTNSGASGQLDFGTGIANNQLWFSQSGDDLLINRMGSSDRVTVDDWFADSTKDLASIHVSSGLIIDSQVSQLVQAMATFAANNPGFDPTAVSQAPSDTDLQNAIAASWHS